MSALMRIADSSRTSRHVRKVPQADLSKKAAIASELSGPHGQGTQVGQLPSSRICLANGLKSWRELLRYMLNKGAGSRRHATPAGKQHMDDAVWRAPNRQNV